MTTASFLIGFANIKAKLLREKSAASSFCNTISKVNRRQKLYHLFDSTHVLGIFQSTKNIPNIILNVLNTNAITFEIITLFHRLFENGVVYNSTSYKRNIKTNFSCIIYNHNNKCNIVNFVDFIRVIDCNCVRPCLKT